MKRAHQQPRTTARVLAAPLDKANGMRPARWARGFFTAALLEGTVELGIQVPGAEVCVRARMPPAAPPPSARGTCRLLAARSHSYTHTHTHATTPKCTHNVSVLTHSWCGLAAAFPGPRCTPLSVSCLHLRLSCSSSPSVLLCVALARSWQVWTWGRNDVRQLTRPAFSPTLVWRALPSPAPARAGSAARCK